MNMTGALDRWRSALRWGRGGGQKRQCFLVGFAFAGAFGRLEKRGNGFGDALLIGERLAGLIHVRRLGVAQQVAQVVEVSDVGGRLFELGVGPMGDELFGGHQRLVYLDI